MAEKYDDLTIFEKYKLIQNIAIYPALTLMVFSRHRIGFRVLKPHYLSIMAVIMLVFSAIGGTYNQSGLWIMPLFALAMWTCGTVQRNQRWRDLKKQRRWHTYSAGISWLEKIKWPDFFTRERRLYRAVEPIAWVLFGGLVATICRTLGAWIVFSALFMCIFEQLVFETALNHALDVQDGVCESETQSELADFFSNATPAEQPKLKLETTRGIPTGIAPDIEFDVAYRRKMKEWKAAQKQASESQINSSIA